VPTTATKYFGELPYEEDTVLFFPAGLLGFPENRRFLLIEQAASRPLAFLQNLEDPALCFLVMPATQVDPGFELFLDAENCRLLDVPAQQEAYPPGMLLCLALIRFDANARAVAANLKGPVVIHIAARKAAQVVQFDADYALRHPVPALAEVLSCW
jgi:flagellar assembly factor FliW